MAPRAQAAPTARPPLPPLMAPERRVALFVVVAAALLVIAAALALALRSPGGVRTKRARLQREAAPVVLRSEVARTHAAAGPGATPIQRIARRARARGSRRRRCGRAREPRRTTRRVERRARAFVAALLRREAGHSSAAAGRSIRATATRAVSQLRPGRVARASHLRRLTPADGRIARVETVRVGRRPRARAGNREAGRHRASVLLVELIRSEGRWRAAALR